VTEAAKAKPIEVRLRQKPKQEVTLTTKYCVFRVVVQIR